MPVNMPRIIPAIGLIHPVNGVAINNPANTLANNPEPFKIFLSYLFPICTHDIIIQVMMLNDIIITVTTNELMSISSISILEPIL